MNNYINNTLVHWTGRKKLDEDAFAILVNIVNERKLYLSYCPNYADSPISSYKTMMACFTDLPLKYSGDFLSMFGKFGIGFSKDAMIKYGANPVFYTTVSHQGRIIETAGLIQKLLREEVDREWKEGEERYQFNSKQLYSLLEVFGFSQEYSYKENHINYYQREWRICYETLPFEAGRPAEKPGNGGIRGNVGGKIMCEMMFAAEDVDYLIVPLKFWNRARKLARLLGCKVMIYEFVVKPKWLQW